MDGGIRTWMGLTAEGPPETAAAYFAAGTGAADMASLAWALEEATRQFYMRLADRNPESPAASLFKSLVQAEENHQGTLEHLHGSLTPEPVSRMYDRQEPKILEGGMEMDAALRWADGKPVTEILELALGLESNAYDRYLRMLDIAEGESSREVFRGIAMEEKGHLKRLADLMDEQLKARYQ
jgi:rubrerythrin